MEFEALKEDIRQNGQQVPISLYHNKVVDGRNRLRACRELGITPLFVSIEDICGSIGAYVVSMNLHRRHLTEPHRESWRRVGLS
ncbi:ParB N-terminal domain-containing protein [Burkholderia vietnamiensis]|uniref:ParB N-terminal domain-containing protein n=1 Tax=Burkholderia vietnamiensis TaxID=60552 RepID=UPI0009BEB957|nr:ParB N-terminal domain-containing protein [Burkholderia vietnamiensis]